MDLDVTLPGEGGKDRPFKVSIKFVSRISWHLLHEVLTGRSLPEPLELDKPISTNPVHAVDVVLRHLPSMKYVKSLQTISLKYFSLYFKGPLKFYLKLMIPYVIKDSFISERVITFITCMLVLG